MKEGQETLTDEQIAEFERYRGLGMTSAVGEYTPDEFWTLLDEVKRGRIFSLAERETLTAVQWVEKRRDDFIAEYGYTDPSTGALEFGTGMHTNLKEDYVQELAEIIEGLCALASPPISSRAAQSTAPLAPAEPVAWMLPYKDAEDSPIEYALDHDQEGREYLIERCAGCDLFWMGTPIALYTTPPTSDRALLPCGHQQSEMLKSAETGEDLYCALCDAVNVKRDKAIEEFLTSDRASLIAKVKALARINFVREGEAVRLESVLAILRSPA